MARQAEAERERRAKVINAEGEFQAAQKLAEAAAIISTRARRAPAALPADAGRDRAENNSTMIFPVPIDMLSSLLAPAIGQAAKRALGGTA